jgi:hypothetical protein
LAVDLQLIGQPIGGLGEDGGDGRKRFVLRKVPISPIMPISPLGVARTPVPNPRYLCGFH